MSRHTTDEASSAGVRRRGAGRHRLDAPRGVRCSDLPAVRARLASLTPRSSAATFFRSLFPSVPTGRHTWDFLAHAGGRPRSAFAIILSL